jgi:hypothetical protein
MPWELFDDLEAGNRKMEVVTSANFRPTIRQLSLNDFYEKLRSDTCTTKLPTLHGLQPTQLWLPQSAAQSIRLL